MPWPKFDTDYVIMTSYDYFINHVFCGSFALKLGRVVKYLTRIRMLWPQFGTDDVIMTRLGKTALKYLLWKANFKRIIFLTVL